MEIKTKNTTLFIDEDLEHIEMVYEDKKRGVCMVRFCKGDVRVYNCKLDIDQSYINARMSIIYPVNCHIKQDKTCVAIDEDDISGNKD